MLNLILAVDSNYGIGIDNKLPWHIPEELKIFKEKTKDSILIVGRKTFEKLPKLKDRIIFCISRNILLNSENNDCIVVFQHIDEAIEQAKKLKQEIPTDSHKGLFSRGSIILESEINHLRELLLKLESDKFNFYHNMRVVEKQKISEKPIDFNKHYLIALILGFLFSFTIIFFKRSLNNK
jgi:dihydrofolate reductase